MKKQVRRTKKNAGWKAVKIDSTAALYRLVGPLEHQKGKQKTICVAIGSKRLMKIIHILNEMEVEV